MRPSENLLWGGLEISVRSRPEPDLQKLSAEASFCPISRRYLAHTGGIEDGFWSNLRLLLALAGIFWDRLLWAGKIYNYILAIVGNCTQYNLVPSGLYLAISVSYLTIPASPIHPPSQSFFSSHTSQLAHPVLQAVVS